jgi:hypothetical protein
MKITLRCSVKLNREILASVQGDTLIEDVNVIDIPDGISDAEFIRRFDDLRVNVLQQHRDTLLSLFTVDLVEIKP